MHIEVIRETQKNDTKRQHILALYSFPKLIAIKTPTK